LGGSSLELAGASGSSWYASLETGSPSGCRVDDERQLVLVVGKPDSNADHAVPLIDANLADPVAGLVGDVVAVLLVVVGELDHGSSFTVGYRIVSPPLGAGRTRGMRGVSFGALYLIVGVVVAAFNDYFDNLESLKAVLELLIAILIWPLVLVGVDINIR
jgi:hypothetical protein